MKILILNYEFPPLGGGASSISFNIAKGYAKLGHHVDVVTMGYKKLPKYEKINNINIYRVKCLRLKINVCTPIEQLTYIFSGYKKACELIKLNKYDICHSHFVIPTGIIAFLLKRKFNLPYIITAHGSDIPGYNNHRFKILHKFTPIIINKIIYESLKIVSPSYYLKKLILNLGYKYENKIEIIPNCIETNMYAPLKKEKYILLVSRLQKGKGIQDFLYVLKNINIGNWKIKIVGDGPYKKKLEHLVKKYSLSNCVEYLGWIDNKSDKLKELYGKASIFCQPSYFENSSIVIFEALQSGCFVIARNTGGNPELLNESQLFIDKNDLELKLNNILNNFDFYSNLEINIQFKKYNNEDIILKYNNLINEK